MEEDDDEQENIADKRVAVVQFQEICGLLADLGFLAFMETLVMEILYNFIENRINSVCVGIYDEYFVESYIEWLDQVIIPFLRIAVVDCGKISRSTGLK